MTPDKVLLNRLTHLESIETVFDELTKLVEKHIGLNESPDPRIQANIIDALHTLFYAVFYYQFECYFHLGNDIQFSCQMVNGTWQVRYRMHVNSPNYLTDDTITLFSGWETVKPEDKQFLNTLSHVLAAVFFHHHQGKELTITSDLGGENLSPSFLVSVKGES